MATELNVLRMAVEEWLDAEGDEAARAAAADRLRNVATPGLLATLVRRLDDVLNQLQECRDENTNDGGHRYR